jgi:hypothetical protein
MSDDVLCDRCGWPVPDTAYVCVRCADVLAERLRRVPAGEAWTTIARLSRTGPAGRTSERPLPFSWEAADATWAAVNTLITWQRHITEASGRDPGPPGSPVQGPHCRAGHSCAHDSCAWLGIREHPLEHLVNWLADQLGWLRYRQEAAEAFDELADAAALTVRTVDLPPVRWYAGPCGTDGCTADLYAASGSSTVTCWECGARHDADYRRGWLLRQAEDTLAHAALAAGAITALGHPCKDATVRQWAHRGRLAAHPPDQRGRPLYRVGDVLDLVRESESRRDRRVA